MHKDLCTEIFKRLSVQTLCRLRCVCKCWNSIISSAFFVDLHNSFTSSRDTVPRNLKPYLHVHVNVSSFHESYYLCCPLDEHKHSRQRLYFPFRADRDSGVGRFSFVNVMTSSFVTAILWNPTIQKYVALPFRESDRPFEAIGFGYDSSRDDFKVVVINDKVSGEYEVYSYRQGCWTTSFSDLCEFKQAANFVEHSRSCFVNGTIHWTLEVPNPNHYRGYRTFSMLMFDCESEEFRRIEIPQPWSAPLHWWSKVGLFEYAGMLAVLVNISYGGTIEDHFGIDIWVMEEHGVSTSWNKAFKIQYQLYPYDISMDICDPSFENRVPYGPNNPLNVSRGNDETFRNILSDRVYEQTMFLMDHPEDQSYTNQEIVTTVSTQDP